VRIGMVLITPDDALWRAFTAVPGAGEARQYDSVGEFIGQWGRSRPAVVVVDARAVGDLATALDGIGAHGTALVPVALVDEARRVGAAALERQRRLFEHLLLPLDAGTAKSVLEHASEEAAARHALQSGDARPEAAAPTAGGAPTPEAPAPTESMPQRASHSPTVPVPEAATVTRPARSTKMPRLPFIAALTIALASLVAAVAWRLVSPGDGTAPGTPAPAAATSVQAPQAVPAPAPRAAAKASAALTRASVDEQVESTLERARTALRERRYIDPAEDNALLHYKAVLALEPANGEARQGLDRIAELLLARAATSLAAHDNAAALRSLEAARAIAPNHQRLAALDAQVNSRASELSAGQVQAAIQAGAYGRATSLLQQAERAGTIPAGDVAAMRQDIARRAAATQLADLARLVQTRISQGQLIEPANDNAKGYLATLAERGGSSMNDEVARLTELYQKRVVSEARAAMAAGAWTQADAWVAELRSTRGGAALAQPLQKDLERRGQESRSAPPEPVASVPPPAPAPAPVAAPPPPVAAVVTAAAPQIVTPAKLARALKVDYPRAAALRNVSGWVTVEVDVDSAGKPGTVRATDAYPKGLFEAAAITAVQRASFVPATASDGSHPHMTVSMRVRFQLDDRP
jgi:TonB family protein